MNARPTNRLGLYLSIAALALIAACASSEFVTGKDFDTTRVDRIEKGKTTATEVERLLGAPYSRTQYSLGEIWTYMYVRSKAKVTSAIVVTSVKSQGYSKMLTLSFDSTSVVQSFTLSVSGDPNLK